MHATDAKTQKIKPDPIFFDGRKFRRQCANVIDNVRSYLFFNVQKFGQKFQTRCAETLTHAVHLDNIEKNLSVTIYGSDSQACISACAEDVQS